MAIVPQEVLGMMSANIREMLIRREANLRRQGRLFTNWEAAFKAAKTADQ